MYRTDMPPATMSVAIPLSRYSSRMGRDKSLDMMTGLGELAEDFVRLYIRLVLEINRQPQSFRLLPLMHDPTPWLTIS